MVRINLFNYRSQEAYYRKLRVFAIVGIAVLISLILNFVAFSYIEMNIMRQETRNSFLNTQIRIIDNQIAPIKDFDTRANDIKKKIDAISIIDRKRFNSVIALQQLHAIVPEKMYFTSIDVLSSSKTANFRGVAAGPLYIAQFLDKLRESGGLFTNPILRTNDTKDQNAYNFEISVKLAQPTANIVEYESDGN